MKFSIGVLDKNENWLKDVEYLIRRTSQKLGIETSIQCFPSEVELKAYEKKIDILFLEIGHEQEENDGVEIALWTNCNYPDCFIIFMSDEPESIMRAYKTNHDFFVLKSCFSQYVSKILETCYRTMTKRRPYMVFKTIGSEQQYAVISYSDILYFERMGRKTRIVCNSGEFFTWEKLSEIENRIDSEKFLRCHNSYLVYIPKVKLLMKDELVMSDDTVIKISRTYRSIVADSFEWIRGFLTK